MEDVLMLLVQWVPWIVPTAGGFYFLSRYVRAAERTNGVRDELAALQTQVLQLEERLANVTEELDRVTEGQRFTTQLLGERAGGGAARTP